MCFAYTYIAAARRWLTLGITVAPQRVGAVWAGQRCRDV